MPDCMEMKDRPIILVVGSECPPQAEAEYHQWYEKHILDLLERGARRAARLKLKGESDDKYPQYLAIYEFENWETAKAYDNHPDRPGILEEMHRTLGQKGVKFTWRAHYEVMKTWQK